MEAEQAALGAMLLERDAIARAVEILRADDFYREAHRIIYEGIVDLFNRHEPVDLITLGEWLKGRDHLETIGGTLYLTTLMSQVPTAAGIPHYAGIIRDKALQRSLIKAADEIMNAAYQGDKDLEELVDESEQKIFSIAERSVSSGFVRLQDLVKEQFYSIDEFRESGTPGTGITFDKLPTSVRIKVYTVSGQLAAEFGSENTSGKLQWDVKNKDGKYLATGGYLAVITSPGLSPATRKLLIIR